MRDLDDVVLIVCGGAAGRIVNGHTPHTVPIVKVHPAGAAERQVSDPDLDRPIASGDDDLLCSRLEGVRAVIIFSILGGFSGTMAFTNVVSCARRMGCKVIAVVGIPLEFEEARSRAFDEVSSSLPLVDRMFIIDNMALYKSMMVDDMKIDAFFRVYEYTTTFAINNIASILEGPFFSTFPERSYTFSYVNTMHPEEAVRRAVENAPYPVDPSLGKMVISLGSGFRTAQIDAIFDKVVSETGILPDVVLRDDLEDNKVLVFLPVRA